MQYLPVESNKLSSKFVIEGNVDRVFVEAKVYDSNKSISAAVDTWSLKLNNYHVLVQENKTLIGMDSVMATVEKVVPEVTDELLAKVDEDEKTVTLNAYNLITEEVTIGFLGRKQKLFGNLEITMTYPYADIRDIKLYVTFHNDELDDTNNLIESYSFNSYLTEEDNIQHPSQGCETVFVTAVPPTDMLLDSFEYTACGIGSARCVKYTSQMLYLMLMREGFSKSFSYDLFLQHPFIILHNIPEARVGYKCLYKPKSVVEPKIEVAEAATGLIVCERVRTILKTGSVKNRFSTIVVDL